jgi:hypothetical protein
LVGLLIGAIAGALVAAGVIAGLGMLIVPVFLGYVLAAATGALTGLVAGKPIWASGGQIEAGLKAFFGALLAAGGLYAIRTWLPVHVPLALVNYMTMLHPGASADGELLLGNLPGAFLPVIAAALGGLYELDNTPETKKDDKGGGEKKGGARVGTKIRIAADADGEEEEVDASPAAKKRSR